MIITWLKKLLAAPVFEDEGKTRTASLLNTMLWAIIVLAVLSVTSDLVFSSAWYYVVVTVILLLSFCGLLLLMRLGYVRLSGILLVLEMGIGLGLITTVTGGVRDPVFIGYTAVIAIAGMLLGGRVAMAIAALGILTGAGLVYADAQGFLPKPIATDTPITLWVTYSLDFVFVAILLSLATRSLSEALQKLRRNEQSLVESNRELQAARASLEQRVAERTYDLERRSSYLAASAEVGRAATSILEADQLMRQVVELVRGRFDLYYVGLFLVDDTGEWAVLRAGTGQAGRAMLARGHRIKIGEGMIGWSIANAQARVALEVGEDAVRLATPELPDTRSEAALPLRSRGKVIGALTVQSTQPGAFDEAAIASLQTMADQVAVALDNARLFAESQAALEAARHAYGELSRQAWVELLRGRADWGYRYTRRSIAPAEGDWRPEMLQAANMGQIVQVNGTKEPALAIPLKVRDQVVGALRFRKGTTGETWTAEEMALLETLVDQLGMALESARLYRDTQRRAARERLINEITARIRSSVSMEAVLNSAVREISQVMDASFAAIDLELDQSEAHNKKVTL
jgi:GAF domain-containing protein